MYSDLVIVHQGRRQASKERAEEVRNMLSPQLQRTVDLNSDPGAALWLLALPLQEQGFYLTKQEFWDALHLHYGWTLLTLLATVFVVLISLLIMP